MIEILASDVTVDMNGFYIEGSGSSGAADEISAPFGADNIEVRNGSIYNMSDIGVELSGLNSRAINVRVRDNLGGGIFVGARGVIRDCSADSSGDFGLSGLDASLLIGNTANGNGGIGIEGGIGSGLRDNVAFANSGHGFEVNTSSTVIGNQATSNSGHGFNIRLGSLVKTTPPEGTLVGGCSSSMGKVAIRTTSSPATPTVRSPEAFRSDSTSARPTLHAHNCEVLKRVQAEQRSLARWRYIDSSRARYRGVAGHYDYPQRRHGGP